MRAGVPLLMAVTPFAVAPFAVAPFAVTLCEAAVVTPGNLLVTDAGGGTITESTLGVHIGWGVGTDVPWELESLRSPRDRR